MATLNGQPINTSFNGLIKTNDNGVLGATEKVITDGLGNESTLSLGTASASFIGDLDLTNATVTGLPDAGIQSVVAGTNVTVDNTDPLNPIVSATGGGAAGLVSGTGSDSMKSADALTASPANASGTGSIALGNNARATALDTISLGNAALADSNYSITIGSSAGYSTGVGTNSISIGADSGYQGGSNALMIGGAATGKASGSVALGYGARVDNAGATDSIAIGFGTTITTAITGAVNFNTGTLTPGLTDTVSVKALATVVDSTPTAGGIIMADAGGIDRRINIDASGTLQIDSTPVGVSPSLSNTTKVTVTTTGADALLQQITIPANTFKAGDILETYGMVSNDFTGGGTIYGNCFVGPDAGANPSGIQLAGNFTSTSAGFSTKRNMIIHTADGTGDGTSTPGIDSANNADDYKSGLYTFADQNTEAINWTQTQYFKFYTYIDNAGSSSTFHGMYIKKVN